VLEQHPEWLQAKSADFEIVVVAGVEDVVIWIEKQIAAGVSYDVVIVDGIEPRSEYVSLASQLVNREGLLVVDNSDRQALNEVLQQLPLPYRLDFFGSGPINKYAWATSVFFREPIHPKGIPVTFRDSIEY
jgi:hypothetical protein